MSWQAPGLETLYIKIRINILPSLGAFCTLFVFITLLTVMMQELEIGSGKSKRRMILMHYFGT